MIASNALTSSGVGSAPVVKIGDGRVVSIAAVVGGGVAAPGAFTTSAAAAAGAAVAAVAAAVVELLSLDAPVHGAIT